jgi:hypothetical protein
LLTSSKKLNAPSTLCHRAALLSQSASKASDNVTHPAVLLLTLLAVSVLDAAVIVDCLGSTRWRGFDANLHAGLLSTGPRLSNAYCSASDSLIHVGAFVCPLFARRGH